MDRGPAMLHHGAEFRSGLCSSPRLAPCRATWLQIKPRASSRSAPPQQTKRRPSPCRPHLSQSANSSPLTSGGTTSPVAKTKDMQQENSVALPLPAADADALTSQNIAEQPRFAHQAGAKWLMVSHPRVTMDYKIVDVGPSGVGKVEIWITKDLGQTWDVLCDDPGQNQSRPSSICLVKASSVFGWWLPTAAISAPICRNRATLPITSSSWTPPSRRRNCCPRSWDRPTKTPASISPGGRKTRTSAPPRSSSGTCCRATRPLVAHRQGRCQHGRWISLVSAAGNRPAGSYVRLVAIDMAGNTTRCEGTKSVPLDDNSRLSLR